MTSKKNLKKESSENFGELEIVQDNVQQPETESNEPKQEGSVEGEAGPEEVPASDAESNDASADQDEEQKLKVADPSHLKPQPEPKSAPPRPKAVDKDHLKPQAETSEQRKVKVADPKHLKPQE